MEDAVILRQLAKNYRLLAIESTVSLYVITPEEYEDCLLIFSYFNKCSQRNANKKLLKYLKD